MQGERDGPGAPVRTRSLGQARCAAQIAGETIAGGATRPTSDVRESDPGGLSPAAPLPERLRDDDRRCEAPDGPG